MSSCCNGNCGWSNCDCAVGCDDCLEISGSGADTIVLGLAPQKTYYEESETAAENGCKCGPNCSCNPCTCK